jgi:hypothetical protein
MVSLVGKNQLKNSFEQRTKNIVAQRGNTYKDAFFEVFWYILEG